LTNSYVLLPKTPKPHKLVSVNKSFVLVVVEVASGLGAEEALHGLVGALDGGLGGAEDARVEILLVGLFFLLGVSLRQLDVEAALDDGFVRFDDQLGLGEAETELALLVPAETEGAKWHVLQLLVDALDVLGLHQVKVAREVLDGPDPLVHLVDVTERRP